MLLPRDLSTICVTPTSTILGVPNHVAHNPARQVVGDLAWQGEGKDAIGPLSSKMTKNRRICRERRKYQEMKWTRPGSTRKLYGVCNNKSQNRNKIAVRSTRDGRESQGKSKPLRVGVFLRGVRLGSLVGWRWNGVEVAVV